MRYSSTALTPDFRPSTKEQALALELAKTLRDTENFACYIALAKRYQEDYLRRVLALVSSVPEKNIKRSRGALFVYLVKNVRTANRPRTL